MADNWYFVKDSRTIGPVSSAQLRELAVAGTVLPTTTVWKEGMTTGTAAAEVNSLFPDSRSIAHSRLTGTDTTPVRGID
jgi:hypothetical protein